MLQMLKIARSQVSSPKVEKKKKRKRKSKKRKKKEKI